MPVPTLFPPSPFAGMKRPQIDPSLWGNRGHGAGNVDSKEHYAQEVEQGIFDAGSEAYRIRDLNESRGMTAEDTLSQAVERAKRPTITDQDIRNLYSRNTDNSAGDYLKGISGLRSYFGGGGVDPMSGLGQGLAANYELGRVGQNVKSRSDITIQKITTDALDRARQVQNAQALSALQARPADTTALDFENARVGVRLGQQGVMTDFEAALKQAAAAKKAGKQAGVGNLIGAGLGAIGSIFG